MYRHTSLTLYAYVNTRVYFTQLHLFIFHCFIFFVSPIVRILQNSQSIYRSMYNVHNLICYHIRKYVTYISHTRMHT